MSSALVSYSSGEEEDGDANYEEVNMEVSSSDEEGKGLFSSKEEYKAYQNQFKPGSSSSSKEAKRKDVAENSEYGSLEPEIPVKKMRKEKSASAAASHPVEEKSAVKDAAHLTDPYQKRQPEQKSEGKYEKVSSRYEDDHRSRRREDGSRRGGDDRKRSSRDRSSRDRDDEYRNRSSRDRDEYSKRRSDRDDHHKRRGGNHRRSPSPSEPRGKNGSGSFQDRRSRKLVAMGITTQEEVDQQQQSSSIHSKQMDAQAAKVKEITGVELPKYYNPTAINPLKYAEQIKKRQMLWGGKKSSNEQEAAAAEAAAAAQKKRQEEEQHKESFNKWEKTNFGSSEANEKFRRLMGIRTTTAEPAAAAGAEVVSAKSASMFAAQEEQYEKARAITHTQRGLGLGFSSSGGFVQHQAAAAAAAPVSQPPLQLQQERKPPTINFIKKS